MREGAEDELSGSILAEAWAVAEADALEANSSSSAR